MIKDFKIFEFINIKSGVRNYVYVSKDYTYAASYANGYTSSAMKGSGGIKNGVIFVIYLDDNILHWGEDIWKTYEDDIKNDLKNYLDTGELSKLLTNIFDMIGMGNFDKNMIKRMIKDPVKNLLQLISPIDWSSIQENDIGYSEIALKEITFDQIIEIRVFKNYELVEVIDGGYTNEIDEDDEYKNIFYHGSPLKFWEDKLKNL